MNLSYEIVYFNLALAAALINFVFAGITFLRAPRNVLYTTFIFICLSIGFWNLSTFMVFVSGEPFWLPAGEVSKTVWKYLGPVGASMVVAFLFHFVNVLTRVEKKNSQWIVTAYLLSLVLAMTPPLSIAYPEFRPFVTGIWWNLTFFFLLFPFLVACIMIVLRAIRRAEHSDEKDRLRYIYAAIVLQVIMGSTDLFQKMHSPIPPLGHFGSIIGPIILAIGVVKHRRAYDVLAQAERKVEMLRELASGIAHEVKNPLTAIKGLLSLQVDVLKEMDTRKMLEYQSILGEEIHRMENILGSYQNFARPLQVNRQSVDINELLEKTVKLVILEQPGIWMIREFTHDLPRLTVDPSLLRQVFLNIIRNADEACGEEGRLLIMTDRENGWLRISFADNGPGIATELKDKVLQPFFSTKDSGIGLGLAIVGRIVESHGGRVEIDNVPPGGARITILLPVE
jgi:signal transduction histidine kinase